MRCWLAALLLCAVSALYAAELDSNHAERLIWEGRFQEAVAYLEPLFLAETPGASHLLCLAYTLWGYDKHTLHYCGYAVRGYWHDALCTEKIMQQKGEEKDFLCRSPPDYSKFAEIKAMQALAHWRSGDAKEAADPLYMALAANKPAHWFVQMVDVAIRAPGNQQQVLSRIRPGLEFWEKPRFDLAYARIFPGTAQQAEADARRRWNYIIAGALGSIAILAIGTAYQQRARIAAFLSTSPSAPAAQPAVPGYPAPYPSYWQAGYMNRAYQIAAYCWVAVWLLVCLPIVVLLAIPAVTILGEFSATGLRSGIANARGFAAGFLGWGRLWFGLLLLSFTGFAVTKIYGRYSLPKPFRPRIRVIRTTLRLVFLAVTLISVGTFLSYFAGIAGGIYANPVVQLLIDILRKSFGL